MKTISKILCKLISFIDYIDYNFIRHKKLIDNYKTIEEIQLNDIEILTDTGYKELSALMISKPFKIYHIELENGYSLDCADEHIVFDKEFNEIYIKDLNIDDYIQTDEGLKKVTHIDIYNTQISMCDTTVNDDNHRFYSNGILSHNSTTTAIFCLWSILFNTDMAGLILSKSGPAGVDLLSKTKDMYLNLPYYLKAGTMKWNQHEIGFDNNSSISTEAFSPTAGLGKTINFLILDEFAWCPPNDVELFYQNVIPTVTTLPNAHVAIMSTQNGFNLFYKLYKGAIEKRNIYYPFKWDWWQVPQFNPDTKEWEKRTEAWKEKMVGVLGSEEAFYYQYGTQFSASNNCLVSRETLSRLREKTVLYETPEDLDIFSLHKDKLFFNPDFNLFTLKTDWFVVLCDLAEGGGGDADSTVFHIMKVCKDAVLKQVGYWKSNEVDLENAALEFWMLFGQLFNPEHVICSIEWNTYGALFYTNFMNLNEFDYKKEFSFRFDYSTEIDFGNIVQYKKNANDENIPGISKNSTSKTIPGIRWNGENKKTACALLRIELEKETVIIDDLVTVGELENFEDKNGNGVYKASFGHDDLIMTLVQIPMLRNTPKFKEFIEDFNAYEAGQSNTSNTPMFDIYSVGLPGFQMVNGFFDLTNPLY